MSNRRKVLVVLLLLSMFVLAVPLPAAALDLEQELLGTWAGTFQSDAPCWPTNTLRLEFIEQSSGLVASVDIGGADRSERLLPVAMDGDRFSFRVLSAIIVEGQIAEGRLVGAFVPAPAGPYWFSTGAWQAQRYPAPDPVLEQGPGPECSQIPDPWCEGTEQYCGELVPFSPEIGDAWINYPVNCETWDNQYRSYVRRDLMMLVKFAAAKTQCKTEGWEHGNHAPLGLGDMSEADGSIPGTSDGKPDHPPGSHTNGTSIDVGYYQLYSEDNHLRPICDDRQLLRRDQHCVGEPYALDAYRTALFMASLSEHPRFMGVIVDAKAGPLIDDALDELVAKGWIDGTLRESIPLYYDEDITEWYYHHHHMHIEWQEDAS
jgi:hypothetical protein